MAKNVVVLTGAGISAESGLKTFRDNDGLWEGHRVEEVATPEAFARQPELVQHFYNLRREQLLSNEVLPNAAHSALANFEKAFAGEFTLVTQNVDNLHQRAGSQNVYPMHGELLKVSCTECGAVHEWAGDVTATSVCPACEAACENYRLRPYIVWFGEMPRFMDVIEQRLSACDLFVSIGTSSVVYPAAGFRQLASSYGAHTVELNLEPSATASQFDEAYYGPATEVVGDFFDKLATA